jgi:hypothetical protein
MKQLSPLDRLDLEMLDAISRERQAEMRREAQIAHHTRPPVLPTSVSRLRAKQVLALATALSLVLTLARLMG